MVPGLTRNGCIINEMYDLCQPDSLILMSGLTISETDTRKDGAINVTVAGGTAPYIFEWYDWIAFLLQSYRIFIKSRM